MFEKRKRSIFCLESDKKNPSRSAVREYYKWWPSVCFVREDERREFRGCFDYLFVLEKTSNSTVL